MEVPAFPVHLRFGYRLTGYGFVGAGLVNIFRVNVGQRFLRHTHMVSVKNGMLRYRLSFRQIGTAQHDPPYDGLVRSQSAERWVTLSLSKGVRMPDTIVRSHQSSFPAVVVFSPTT